MPTQKELEKLEKIEGKMVRLIQAINLERLSYANKYRGYENSTNDTKRRKAIHYRQNMTALSYEGMASNLDEKFVEDIKSEKELENPELMREYRQARMFHVTENAKSSDAVNIQRKFEQHFGDQVLYQALETRHNSLHSRSARYSNEPDGKRPERIEQDFSNTIKKGYCGLTKKKKGKLSKTVNKLIKLYDDYRAYASQVGAKPLSSSDVEFIFSSTQQKNRNPRA